MDPDPLSSSLYTADPNPDPNGPLYRAAALAGGACLAVILLAVFISFSMRHKAFSPDAAGKGSLTPAERDAELAQQFPQGTSVASSQSPMNNYPMTSNPTYSQAYVPAVDSTPTYSPQNGAYASARLIIGKQTPGTSGTVRGSEITNRMSLDPDNLDALLQGR